MNNYCEGRFFIKQIGITDVEKVGTKKIIRVDPCVLIWRPVFLMSSCLIFYNYLESEVLLANSRDFTRHAFFVPRCRQVCDFTADI